MERSTSVAPPGPPARPWWRHPLTGVVALVAAMLGLSAGAWAAGLTGGGPPLTPHIPWWLLAALFGLAEVVVLHIQIRREAQSVSLSEIPLVIAVLTAPPEQVLLAGVVGAGTVYLLQRRPAPVKTLFNLTLRVFGATLALVVFHALAFHAPTGPDPAGPLGWTAAVLGAAAAGTADGVLVLAVVALHEGIDRGQVMSVVRFPLVSAVVACFGVLVVVTLHADVRSLPLLLVTATTLVLGYRAHASLNDRHVSLAQLYDFGRAVTGAHVADDILSSALDGARTLLKAEAAEVVLLGAQPGDPPRRWLLAPGSGVVRSDDLTDAAHPAVWRSVLVSGTPVLAARGAVRDATPGGAGDAAQLAALGYREGIVVALRDDARVLGSLMVAERMGDVRSFQADDIATLETIANQAGLALAKQRLLGRMQHEALHDVLTGLANRAKFRDAALQSLRDVHAGRSAGCAVLLIDLDGFKEVNDSLGHHHGDALLVLVAQALREVTPAEATVSRLGGDEFAILLPRTADAGQARAVATTVHEVLSRPVVIEGIEVQVRASVGISLAPDHGEDVSSLLRAADTAMYRVKAEQGGTQVYTPQVRDVPPEDPASRTRLALLADLRRAVADGALTVHVQPQADAGTGEVVGAEALVRWEHPALGLLPPSEFLALADRHGLMRDVTALVLDRAVEAARGWRSAGLDLSVSVNLPARSLGDGRTLAMVDAALAGNRLPPGRLTLEITEDSVIGDPETAITLLHRLRERGVRLSVDDFGTGYSSLSYLRRLPVDEVKIDRSFVAHLTHDTHDLLIARSIIDLGRNLGLDVVVEGVEDRPTWDHLADLGAHIIQGYHLARPMPVTDLLPWLGGYNASRRGARDVPQPRRDAARRH